MSFKVLFNLDRSVILHMLSLCFGFQPRKIEEIKDFLLTARRKDAKCEC